MKKLTTLLSVLCLSAWTVGCQPEAGTSTPATDTGAAAAPEAPADAPAGETPAAEGGSTTETP